jgi:hypothetical protein
MIAYADFEIAIARWKARASGVPMPAEPAASGAVEAEIPNATDPGGESDYVVEQESGFVSSETRKQASGSIIISDSLYEPPPSDPE